MATTAYFAVLCMLLSTVASHPGVYSIEEHIPAGSRVGITAPLGSNGERVLVKTVAGIRNEGGRADAVSKPESEPTVSIAGKTPEETVVITAGAPAESAPVVEIRTVEQEQDKPAAPAIAIAAPAAAPEATTLQKSTKQAEPRRAKVVLVGSAPGEILFDQAGPEETVRITGQISGLTANSKHGFHVHVYGDVGNNCAAAAGHFNPAQVMHGAPDADMRHVGDLGNILADENGVANIDMEDKLISLFDGPNNILGRGIVVHAGEDDLGLGGDDGSKATGNAGARLSCGVIGVTAPAKKN